MLNRFIASRTAARRGFLAGVMILGSLAAATAATNSRAAEPVVSAANNDAAKITTRQYDVTDLVQSDRRTVANLAIIAPTTKPSEEETRGFEYAARDIATKICNTVAYNSWQNLPPITVQTTSSSAKLIISQTPDVQDEIAALLQQFRETRQLKVAMEYHLICVDPEAADTAAMLQKKSATIDASKAHPFYNNSFLPAQEAQVMLKTLRTTKGVQINDFELSPFQNEHGAVAVQEAIIPYVAAITGAGHFNKHSPIFADASTGEMFDVVQAISSADHKYMTMDLRFQWSHFERFETIASKTHPDFDYQEPIEQFAKLNARITVPDEQYVLISVPAPELLTIKHDAPATRPSTDAAQKPIVRPSLFLLISTKIQAATRPAMQ